MRFSATQYDAAIEALVAAREQLAPDARSCRICHDTGHQAWECGHNPLLAMSACVELVASARLAHDDLHAIEFKMDEEDQTAALVDWREDTHALLHYLSGHDHELGQRTGPACVVLPEGVAS